MGQPLNGYDSTRTLRARSLVIADAAVNETVRTNIRVSRSLSLAHTKQARIGPQNPSSSTTNSAIADTRNLWTLDQSQYATANSYVVADNSDTVNTDNKGVDIYDERTLVQRNMKGIDLHGPNAAAFVSNFLKQVAQFNISLDSELKIESFVITGIDLGGGNNIEFTIGETEVTIEIGNIVKEFSLAWEYNGDIVEQFITEQVTGTVIPLDIEARSITAGIEIWNNVQATLTAINEQGQTATADVFVYFGLNQYWGKRLTDPTNETEVISLGSQKLVSGKTAPVEFIDSTQSEFCYFAYPNDYGALGKVIDVNTGNVIPTVLGGSIAVNNSFNYPRVYDVYKTVNATTAPVSWGFESNKGILLPDGNPQEAPDDSLLTEADTDNYLIVDGANYLGTGQ